MKKLITALLFLAITNFQAQNQLDLLVGDMLVVVDKFIEPATHASVYQSSSGWSHTAKAKPLYNIDVGLHYNTLFLSEIRGYSLISNSDFKVLRLQNGKEKALIPNALGGKDVVFFEGNFGDNNVELQSFEGVNKKTVSHPFLQGSIELWQHTNLSLRYSPKIAIGDVNFDIFGVSLQHNISQYFKRSNPNSLQVALLASYSTFNFNFAFEQEDILGAKINTANVSASSWFLQFLTSKKLNKFELYCSMSFIKSNFDYLLGGEGELILNILNQSLQTLDTVKENFKADIGFNFNFWKMTAISSISLGKYPNTNLGLIYKLN